MNKIVIVNKARQLYEIIRKDILDGEKYKVGDKLPSIRDLAREYDLNKNTVNTVISMLVSDGLVSVREGAGTYITFKKQEIRLIGVMLFDFCTGMRVDTDILKYIQMNLPGNYYLSLMDTSNRFDVFCDGLSRLCDMDAQGFLIIPPKDYPQPEALERAKALLMNRPTVMINRTIAGIETDSYSMNLGKGIEKAFEYLFTLGKRSTAIVLHDDSKFINEELRAYTKCCMEYGLTFRKDFLIDFSSDPAVIDEQVRGILPQIDSIIAPDDILVQIRSTLQIDGRKVPQDFSLIGINDTTYSKLFNPPLTSIAFPTEKIARSAIHRLIQRIEGNADLPIETINFEPELIIRNT